MRAVKCVVGTYMSVVDDNECNAATRPTDTQVNPAILSPSSDSVCMEVLQLQFQDSECQSMQSSILVFYAAIEKV